MKTFLSTFALAALSAAGCAEPPGSGTASSDAALAVSELAGSFKLYPSPGFEANPQCDRHTALTLDGNRAYLREAVDGVCEIDVAESPREYRLRIVDRTCGSLVIKGRSVDDERIHDITITDHRARSCDDPTPASIVVEETDANGALQTRYSAP